MSILKKLRTGISSFWNEIKNWYTYLAAVWLKSFIPNWIGIISLTILIIVIMVTKGSLTHDGLLYTTFKNWNFFGLESYTNGWDEAYRGFHKIFTFFLDPTLAVATGIIGFFIWYNQNLRRHTDLLPKRMTVHFVLYDKNISKNKIIASCYEAALAHEGDIRNWGQQIGRQFFEENFKMFPYFDIEKPINTKSEIETRKIGLFRKKEKHIRIRLYKVTVFLNAESTKEILERGKKYEETETRIWYENNSKNPSNRELKYKHGFMDKTKSLTTILEKDKEEFIVVQTKESKEVNFDIKIDQCIRSIQNLNKRIGELIDNEDRNAIMYLEDQKRKEGQKLDGLLKQKAAEQKEKKAKQCQPQPPTN